MRKFCKSYYIYRIIKYVIGIILATLISIPTKETEVPEVYEIDYEAWMLIAILGLAIMVITIIYNVVAYHKNGYEITNDGISVTRGIFFKKKSILTYDKMHAINKKQGIIQKIFNVEGLYIDSGATTRSQLAEIIIFDTPETLDKIVQHINEINYKKEHHIEPTIVKEKEDVLIYRYSVKDKLVNCLMGIVGTLLILMTIYLYINIVSRMVMLKEPDFLMILGIVAGLTILIVAFVTFVVSFLAHFDFKLSYNSNEILVSYGTFVKVANKLPIKKVKAIRIQQGLIKKIFGYATLKVDLVGYVSGSSNEENGSSSMGVLIPCSKINEIEAVLKEILPKYVPVECNYSSKYFFPHISVGLFFSSLVVILAYIPLLIAYVFGAIDSLIIYGASLIYLGFYVLLIILVLGVGFLEYKNARIKIEDDRLIISNGSLVQQTVVVQRENVIAIENYTTWGRKKKGVNTYKIHIHSNALLNVIKVQILDVTLNEKLINFLQY